MLAADIRQRIAEVVKVLVDFYALAVPADVESHAEIAISNIGNCSEHFNVGKWIIEVGRWHANARQCECPGNATCTSWRIRKTHIGIFLPEAPGQTMEADRGLVEKMIIYVIGVGKREVAKTVREGLRKPGYGHYIRQKLAARKSAGLIAIHVEESSGNMALLALI